MQWYEYNAKLYTDRHQMQNHATQGGQVKYGMYNEEKKKKTIINNKARNTSAGPNTSPLIAIVPICLD